MLCQLAHRTGVIQLCVTSLCASQTHRHTPHFIEGLMMRFISEEAAVGPSLSQFFLGSMMARSQHCPTYHISLPYESTQSERYCCFRCSFEKVLWKAALKLWSPTNIHPPPPLFYALQSHPIMPAVFFTLLNSTLLLRPTSLKGESLESW